MRRRKYGVRGAEYGVGRSKEEVGGDEYGAMTRDDEVGEYGVRSLTSTE